MRTYKRLTVNIPPELQEVFEVRMRELKYRSASAYFLSLLVFDLYARRPHMLTGQLHNERQEMQDRFYTDIAQWFKEGGKKSKGWFEKRLRELLDEERAKLPGLEAQ